MTVQDHAEQNNIKSDKKKKRKNEKSNVKGNDEVILTNKKLNAYVVFHLLLLLRYNQFVLYPYQFIL